MPKLVEFRYLRSNQEQMEDRAERMGLDSNIFKEEVEQEWLDKIVNLHHITDISPITLRFDDGEMICALINVGGNEYITDIPHEEFINLMEEEFGEVATYIQENKEDDKES